MSWTRRWYRAASAVLLIGSGLQLSLHAQAHGAAGGAAAFYSLGFAAGLALLGTTHWVLAREGEPRSLRRHALRMALLGLLACGAAAWWHPLPPGLILLGLPTLLFALAALPRPHDL